MALVSVGAVLGAVGNRTYRVWVARGIQGTAISLRCRDLEEGYGFCRGVLGAVSVRLETAPTVYGLGCECLPSI